MVDQEPGAYVWITLRSPSGEEMEKWARTFGLHPLAIEDTLHAHQRPKVERAACALFP